MQTTLSVTLFVLATAGSAFGQPSSRFEVGPVLRLDSVSVEGGGSGATRAAGVVASVRIWKSYGVEGEITSGSKRIQRSYEGWFVSYAERGATREEIERLAPTARRTLGYAPGIGGSAAFVIRGDLHPRVTLALRAGVSARRYEETTTHTILTIPAGIDPVRVASNFPSSSRDRIRGGLLFGSDVAFAVTDRLSVAPEVRYVYGGPAQIGQKHRELGLGTRLVWRF